MASWTVSRNLSWFKPGDHTINVGEDLVSDDPATLSAAVTVLAACPPVAEEDDEGGETYERLPLPVDLGDEAVGCTGTWDPLEGGYWRSWSAYVRVADVLMLVRAREDGRDSDPVILSDELFIDVVTTAASKLHSPGP